jgi:hypothetical protein
MSSKAEVFLPLVALLDEFAGNFQNGQRGQAQKVELHQADGLHIVLVKLAHRRLAARLLVQRAKIGQLARRNQHATGVHADVARHALELLRHSIRVLTSSSFLHALSQHAARLAARSYLSPSSWADRAGRPACR